jgi:type IV pilus assembly protein PilN
VILINLLPHREAKRARRKTAFLVGLALSALVGLAITGVWWAVVQQMIASQQQRNGFLTGEIKKLDAQIRDIANLRSEIDARSRSKTSRPIATFRSTC